MSLAFKRLKVYVRLVTLIGATVAVLMVLINNRSHTVPVWFFWLTDETQEINVIWLMLCTAVATLILWWVFSFSWALVKDMREVQRVDAEKADQDASEKRELQLQEREKRIDEKLKQAITQGEEES